MESLTLDDLSAAECPLHLENRQRVHIGLCISSSNNMCDNEDADSRLLVSSEVAVLVRESGQKDRRRLTFGW